MFIKSKYFPASYFYRQFKAESQKSNSNVFHKLVKQFQIDHIKDPFRNQRLYSIKDWNRKVNEHYKIPS